MIIKQITPKWWTLTSDDGFLALTFFGMSKAEVLHKFQSYVRDHDLENIRYTKKNLRRVQCS